MIKLENIVNKGFDRKSGEAVVQTKEEYVCDKCRRLVEPDDKFCWFCGDELVAVTDVEHYVMNEKLSHEEYQQIKGLNVRQLKQAILQRKSLKDSQILEVGGENGEQE